MHNTFIYPNFPGGDKFKGIIRIAGPGLGNLLFDFAGAIVLAGKIPNTRLIWPNWCSVKVGTFIRRERDKRLYLDLFQRTDKYVHGIRKVRVLLLNKKIPYSESVNLNELRTNDVLLYSRLPYSFDELLGFQKLVREELLSITKENHKRSLEEDYSNVVGIHVRLGDFIQGDDKGIEGGEQCRSLSINWYCNVISSLRELLPHGTRFFVFSDASDDELSTILDMGEDISRKYYGSAIADMIALSRSSIIVSTLSSFSAWALYLGEASWITYPSFMKNYMVSSLCEWKRENGFMIKGTIDGKLTEL